MDTKSLTYHDLKRLEQNSMPVNEGLSICLGRESKSPIGDVDSAMTSPIGDVGSERDWTCFFNKARLWNIHEKLKE